MSEQVRRKGQEQCMGSTGSCQEASGNQPRCWEAVVTACNFLIVGRAFLAQVVLSRSLLVFCPDCWTGRVGFFFSLSVHYYFYPLPPTKRKSHIWNRNVIWYLHFTYCKQTSEHDIFQIHTSFSLLFSLIGMEDIWVNTNAGVSAEGRVCQLPNF